MPNPVKIPVKSWQCLSFDHMASAHFFSQNALEIENKRNHAILQRPQYLDLRFHHQAYVIGAIFSAVAFLEATINELFLEVDKYARGDHVHQNDLLRQLLPPDIPFQDPITPLTQDVITAMAHVWNGNRVRFNEYPGLRETLTYLDHEKSNRPRNWFVLNKYQLALYLAGQNSCCKNFDKADPLWVEAELLIKLRHYLMHYSPEWIAYQPHNESYDAQKKRTTLLVNELRNRGFKNPLIPEGEIEVSSGSVMVSSFSSLLGANCAEWADVACRKFVCDFAKRMPVEMYEKMYCP
jgi:hypothetical protein